MSPSLLVVEGVGGGGGVVQAVALDPKYGSRKTREIVTGGIGGNLLLKSTVTPLPLPPPRLPPSLPFCAWTTLMVDVVEVKHPQLALRGSEGCCEGAAG